MKKAIALVVGLFIMCSFASFSTFAEESDTVAKIGDQAFASLQPAMCLSRGKEEIFLKPMHKNTNLSAFVKGKTSVLRPPLTNASKFV